MNDTPDWGPTAPWALSGERSRKLSMILEVLEGDEHAPTAIRDPKVGATLHLADSLAALEITEVAGAERIADLGSGAGFPGLPLAVMLPQARVSLIESQHRKCDFLERLCTSVGVRNAQVICARAEEWVDGVESNDIVTARALAAQAVVLEYSAPLLRLGGVLVDWRGRRSAEEEEQADRAAETLGMKRKEIRHVSAVEGATDHHLHVFVKLEETPSRFPRRPGVARKRPLR